MKRSEVIFSIIQIPIDYFVIIGAALAAYSIRFTGYAISIRPAVSAVPFDQYLRVSLVLAGIWLLIFAAYGLYAIGRPRRFLEELGRIISACTSGIMLAILIIFFYREFFASRFIILAAWGLAVVFVFVVRMVIRLIRKFLIKAGIGVHRLVILGSGKNAETLIREFAVHPSLGFRVEKIFADFDDKTKDEIVRLKDADKIDEIFFAPRGASRQEIVELNNFAADLHIPLKYTADPYAAETPLTDITSMAGIPVVEIKKSRLEGWGKIYKRVFDFVSAVFFIVLFSPILLLIAIAVKLTSSGPVIYQNERIGEDGKPFDVLKFRTMYSAYSIGKQFAHQHDALAYEDRLIRERGIKAGPVYKIKNDPRVTPVGKFLRKTSLDELPQLFNVLIGNMSFVGPRPHQPREVDRYERRHLKVLNIKPGITGMAQVSGRSDLDFEDEVWLDTYYIENWSLALDIYIIFKTPLVVFTGRGSY